MESKNNNRYNFSLSKIFSSGLLKKLDDDNFENDIKYLLNTIGILPVSDDYTFVELLGIAYDYLKFNYRCEYIYKNEILNQILLRHYNDNSATILNEFGINQSIADLVIINGETVAYEIKTELDNFDRLDSQLKNYALIFDKVYVVTHEGALNPIKNKIEEKVGIILFKENGELVTERYSKRYDYDFNSTIAANTLRQSELIQAYTLYEGEMPDMGTGYIGSFCKKWYENIDRDSARFIFYESLKSRKPSDLQFDLIKNFPYELRMLLIGKGITKKNCIELNDKFKLFA